MGAPQMTVAIDDGGRHARAHVPSRAATLDLRGDTEHDLMTAVLAQAHAEARTSGRTITVAVTGADTGPMRLEVDPDQTMRAAAVEPEPGPANSADHTPPRSRPATATPVVQVPTGTDTATAPAPVRDRGATGEAERRTRHQLPVPHAGRTPALRQHVADTATPDDGPGVVSPAREGLRGTLNTLGFTLPPRSGSAEDRARRTAAVTGRHIATVGRQLHTDATIAVLNPKGGVGKTPLLLGLADTLATYRPATSIVAFDVSDSGGGLADRAALGADRGPDVWDILEHAEELTAPGVRASALGRFTIRQPTGVDIVPGYRRIAAAAIDRHACEILASVLRRHRQMLLVDTGNNPNSTAWQWAAAASDVLLIPVPLRGTIPGTVAEMIDDLAGVVPDVLGRVLMLITEGPDDDPETEFDDVEAFIRGGIAPDRFVRIPYDRLLHSGRIDYQQLQPDTRAALITAAAKVIDLLAGIDPTTESLIDTTDLHSLTRPQPITRIGP